MRGEQVNSVEKLHWWAISQLWGSDWLESVCGSSPLRPVARCPRPRLQAFSELVPQAPLGTAPWLCLINPENSQGEGAISCRRAMTLGQSLAEVTDLPLHTWCVGWAGSSMAWLGSEDSGVLGAVEWSVFCGCCEAHFAWMLRNLPRIHRSPDPHPGQTGALGH